MTDENLVREPVREKRHSFEGIRQNDMISYARSILKTLVRN